MPSQFQNIVAVERKVSEISPENDVKVRVVGLVVSKSENGFLLDDGTGTIQVFINSDLLKNVEEKKLVRVFGRVTPTSDKFELTAEIVQDMAKLNMKTYDNVQKLWKKHGVSK